MYVYEHMHEYTHLLCECKSMTEKHKNVPNKRKALKAQPSQLHFFTAKKKKKKNSIQDCKGLKEISEVRLRTLRQYKTVEILDEITRDMFTEIIIK